MKLSRQVTVLGSAIFCVVIFSLYLMLHRGHPRSPRREGSFPQMAEFGSKDLTFNMHLMNGTMSPLKSLWCLIPIMTQKEEKSSISYPSLLSHITSSFLNHPVFPMAVKAEFSTKLKLLSEFRPLLSSLPCDIHLVNLRTIQSKVGNGYSDEAALSLHRKGFNCQFSSRNTGLLFSTTQGKILVQKLFSKFTVESLIPSSLSLMHSPQDAQNISEISLSPMEISTFQIRLR